MVAPRELGTHPLEHDQYFFASYATACAPQLSKRQAAPKLSTTNKPNRQNTRLPATHSPKEKYGLRSSVEQTSGRS